MRSHRHAPAFGNGLSGHWLRRRLPSACDGATETEPRLRISAIAVREFLLAYCACFLAVSTFLL